MARAKKRRGGAGKRGKKTPSLDRLKPDEAAAVLRRLLADRPPLRAEAEEIARTLLADVSFEGVAGEIEFAVEFLDIDDINDRAGDHGSGYVDPTEAAWELLDEAVEPLLEDMKRLIELGLEAEALETCKGILLGLYRVGHGKENQVIDWAPDFAEESAGEVVREWCVAGRKGGRDARKRPKFPQEFVDEFLSEWSDLIARAMSQGRGLRSG